MSAPRYRRTFSPIGIPLEPGRWRRIADLLSEAGEGRPVGAAIAEVASGFLGVDHVSLTLVVAGGAVSNVGSGDAATELAGVQFTLGEGPSVEAASTGVPVLLDDVRSPEAAARAPMFCAAAQQRGVAAVFAFPLRVGEALIGTLTAHRSTAGPLSAAQFADGLIVSSLATVALLQLKAGGAGGDLQVSFGTSNGEHAAVQVAGGMVSEQLSVTIVEALVRIRAHAFMSDAELDDVARHIIDRSLRLER